MHLGDGFAGFLCVELAIQMAAPIFLIFNF